ncbi:KAP family NTPase [Chloroflexi bacterium TSY]|nr:KAP family NTPase [Chloroflexi bacterium TSY]
MNRKTVTILSDKPVQEDKLAEFNNAVSKVAVFIEDSLTFSGAGPIIGVYGEWGSGKTSFAHLVALKLSSHQPLWFHPTYYNNESEVAAAFFESALQQIQIEATGIKRIKIKTKIRWRNLNLPGGVKNLFSQLLAIIVRLLLFVGGSALVLSLLSSGNLTGVGAAVGALVGSTAIIIGLIQKALEPGLSLDLDKFVRQIEAKPGTNKLEQYIKEFQWIAGLARSSGTPFLVMVDEIDDGLPFQTALIIEALRLFGTGRIPCVFVVLADKMALETSVQTRFLNQLNVGSNENVQANLVKMAGAYLDKIIRNSVELPPPPPDWQENIEKARRLTVPRYNSL